ncbi:hypothetical protein HC256_000982 [Beauveria bassiana]|nr:hypothetical protein HC256_000982 [Beauveria bassiana]
MSGILFVLSVAQCQRADRKAESAAQTATVAVNCTYKFPIDASYGVEHHAEGESAGGYANR